VTSSVFELLRYYKWYKFSIIYDTSTLRSCVSQLGKRSSRSRSSSPTGQVSRTLESAATTRSSRTAASNPFVKIVQNTSANTRIYVFLGDKTDLGKLLMALQVQGLLNTGNYMVIYVDIESYTEDMAHQYFRLHEVNKDEHNNVMMSAQSLLVLVPTPPRGDKYTEFEDKVRHYNAEEPFKFKASEIFLERLFCCKYLHITPYASYLYDAVTLYADALSKALKNNTDPKNGKEIMRIFRERTQYTSVTGAIMRIDKDGGAEGNYTVLSWQPTPENLKLKMPSGHPAPPYCMLPVGRFYAVDNRELRFKLEKEIIWVIKDKPPVDEPPADSTALDAQLCGIKRRNTFLEHFHQFYFCVHSGCLWCTVEK
ncbi:speract receptor, partial [Caerostris extrusa]